MRKKIWKSIGALGLSAVLAVTTVFSGIGETYIVKAEEDEGQVQIINDFEDGKKNNWVFAGGWEYDSTATVSPVDFGDEKVIQIDVDYSPYSDISWSEAKISKNFTPSLDATGYNYLVVDVYIPASWDLTKFGIKFYSHSGLDKDVVLENVVDAGNGYVKGTATARITSCSTEFTDLYIGFVGKNADFGGAIYVDNIRFTEVSATDVSVELTTTAGEATIANISGMDTNVTLADDNATETTKKLYAYLLAVGNNDQVIFGHQNDYHKMITPFATEGDTKALTGSVSGIYGVDTLALTGVELGVTNTATALSTMIENSIAAAEQGAIITLSTHMPNMSNSKIVENEDGTFDFAACDFSESKDLSNNCAQEVLEGGAYNAQLNAYLDIIAEYALALQEEDIPLIFRPYHENNGDWFWWGSTNDVETFVALYQYTVDYLTGKGVHNILYVYSPNGPFDSAETYLERYPGDDYVDILAFDYYDDYNVYPATADNSFFEELTTTCTIISDIANEKGKVAAISETGVRLLKADGADMEGLLPSENPISEAACGTNWYLKVADIADEAGMPYFLVWANYGERNFYVPYLVSETSGHEMADDFINFYNSDKTIFADGTNFYGASAVEETVTEEATTEKATSDDASASDATTEGTTKTEETPKKDNNTIAIICAAVAAVLVAVVAVVMKGKKKK